jgi:hypothetical protein
VPDLEFWRYGLLSFGAVDIGLLNSDL